MRDCPPPILPPVNRTEAGRRARLPQAGITRLLDRYRVLPGRDVERRLDALAGRIEQLAGEITELLAVVAAQDSSVPALNDASGDLVLSRYRPVLQLASSQPGAGSLNLVELVDSDVGPVVFPCFDRWIRPTIRDTGAWEPTEGEYLRKVLRPGMTVLNIGANVGYSALVMAGAVGEAGLVIAFEPEPLNFELLCLNLRRNKAANVLPIHSAAGERTGSIRLQRSPDNTGDHRTATHPLGIASLEVPLVAIDDLLPADRPIHAAFLDAQGYDHRVIAGMRKTIRRWRPFMLVEFWPTGILEVGDDPDAVLDGYRAMGYQMALLPDHDVSYLSAEDILGSDLAEGRDHVTLLLRPK